jgi:hypothetical protein
MKNTYLINQTKQSFKRIHDLLLRPGERMSDTQLTLKVAIISILLATFGFSLTQYLSVANIRSDQRAYTFELDLEITNDVSNIEIHNYLSKSYPPIAAEQVVPVTVVYEAGLQNGYIDQLPLAVQAYLSAAYRGSQEIKSYEEILAAQPSNAALRHDIQIDLADYSIDLQSAQNIGINFDSNFYISYYVYLFVTLIIGATLLLFFCQLVKGYVYYKRPVGGRKL